MEAMLASNMGSSDRVDGSKVQTNFAKDIQKNKKYTLADSSDRESVGMDYHIQTITKDDKLRILKFLRRFFFRDEPLNHSIQLIPEGEDSTCLELEEYCSMSAVENNLSLMAVSTSGAIVGVMLNGKAEPPSKEEPEYITNCENPKFKKILRLLRYVDQNVNRDERYRGMNVLEIRIISVDSSWRGKGIGKALIEKAIEIGREKDFHFVRADCSSFFSGKLCAGLGFEPTYELPYSDYVDEDGKPVFSPALPHTSVVSYVKKL
ncbi:arylalkylamine N-acetyltransferase 1-like isoform X2 [Hylaeus anthracinus]|uniref:arylalkylamine N-acetyltransferase 1-like isoform X2 n=1 Tax=Hylaeus anthracinus TaxID=313031 RepID=UPI0023B910BE|nr:arylalkylamine N-acetyltransferase 1-like isoform X2 [Hylaeus anthracinus]